LISTNPKPRERPVSRSVTTVADSHVPTCANSDSSSALVVEKDRFPTKIFLPMALSCPLPGRLWFGRSCLSEKPRSSRERRAHITRKQEDAEVMRSFSFVRNGRTRRARTDQLI